MCSSRLTYTLLQNSEAALSIKMKTTLKITECGSKKIRSDKYFCSKKFIPKKNLVQNRFVMTAKKDPNQGD